METKNSDKYFLLIKNHYAQFQQKRSLPSELVEEIFQPYSTKLQQTKAQNISLFNLFDEFIQLALRNFKHLPFQKLSTLIEICAHVFEHTFETWMSKNESHLYFTEVAVRHSLFRPPHSVDVFSYDDLIAFSKWWIHHFHNYFEEYSQCFASELNRVLNSQTPLIPSLPQKNLENCAKVQIEKVLSLLK